MTERLTDNEVAYLTDLIARGFNPLLAPLMAPLGKALAELQARRAAEPTKAQRAWYLEKAEEHAVAARDWARTGWSHPRHTSSLAYNHGRLAAHFGRLAQGE